MNAQFDFSKVKMPLRSEEIKNLIPHRFPFLLVDGITEVEEKSIKGFKNVSINEPFFQGHFPEVAVMPGVLIIEALAQIGCIHEMLQVPTDSDEPRKIGVLAGIDKVRFKTPVFPGDQLILNAEFLWRRKNIGKCIVEAYVQENLAASGELTFALVDKVDIL